MIDFDVETNGFQPWCGHRAFLFQFGDEAGHTEALRPGVDDARIQWWFDRGSEQGLEAWNTKFDRAFGAVGGYKLPDDGCWHDGMVRAHIINERRSVALKAVGAELLGDERGDLQKEVKAFLTAERARRKKDASEAGTELVEPTYADVPDDLMVPYALEDIDITREVRNQYAPLLKENSQLGDLYSFEMKVLDALFAMEKRGLPASESDYRRLELEVIENLDPLEDACIKLAEDAGVKDFQPNSTPQILAALEARNADMSYMEKKAGKVVSADKDQLAACDDDLAAAILKFRTEYRVLSTYVRPMLGRHYDKGARAWMEAFIAPDERIHASYRQVGARTGRMSCAAPNMQNQPRDDLRLRYNIRAEEGHKLVACDLSNIEMRVFAAYAGEGRMLEAVRENADLHVTTAELIGITDRKRTGGDVESARQRGKTYNFSVVYGGGVKTIVRQLRVSKQEAQLLKQRYYRAYPEVERLQNRIDFRLQDQGYIQDMWGRRYRCFDARKEAYKFTNYLVQGTASEIFKEAVVALHADGVPVVALVHDEIVAHVPERDAVEVENLIIKRLTEQSQKGGKFWDEGKQESVVPLQADGGIYDRWSDAKPLKDGGLFVPRWARG